MAAWTKQLSQLRDALALLIPFRESVITYLDDAGINWVNIDLNVPQPITLWHNILRYSNNNDQVNELVQALLVQFPKNPHLLSFQDQIEYDLGEDMKNKEWKEELSPATLEKITSEVSTLLPISFLETGLKKAKSVARVVIKRGNKMEVGTGFLLENNLFLTNNHVIKDMVTAQVATIQFDYEESENGLPVQFTEFKLNPAQGFATSQSEDWTAVRVDGDANAAFGAIPLGGAAVAKDDFVNIIQHPGGRFKQIGLYHNMVTFSDEKIVQYLTDTEPGSSGSPVFNSEWEVVALHHSGGMLREPGTVQKLLRNEGININAVIAGIKANNL